MKKIYTFFFFLAFSSFPAQTLTQAFNEPVVGDIDRSIRLDTTAYITGLPLKVTGNNCLWDFTALYGIFPMVVDSFITPSAAPNSSAYPAATFVQNRDKIYTFYKSNTNPTQTEMLGGYTPSLTLTFTNTAIVASYPISYGYNLVDAVSGSFKYNSTTGACNGNATVTADGIGTLSLANGLKVPNVIRLKSVEVLTLSTSFVPVGMFSQTIYNYYEQGKKFPVVNVGYTTYQLLAGTPTITALAYGNQNYFNLLGIHESAASANSYKAFPNPFDQELHITLNTGDNVFSFYSLDGQLALQTKQLLSEELQVLEKGVYCLEIKNDKGVFRQKIVKQ